MSNHSPSAANSRADILKSIIGESPKASDIVGHVLSRDASANPPELPADLLVKARLANSLITMTGGNEQLVTKLVSDPKVQSLRDVALNNPVDIPLTSKDVATSSVKTAAPVSTNTTAFHTKLFQAEPSAVLQRMVSDKQVCVEMPLTRVRSSY